MAFLLGVALFVIVVVAFLLGVALFVIVVALFLSMTMMVFETIDEFIGFGHCGGQLYYLGAFFRWPEPVSLSTHPDPSRLRR